MLHLLLERLLHAPCQVRPKSALSFLHPTTPGHVSFATSVIALLFTLLKVVFSHACRGLIFRWLCDLPSSPNQFQWSNIQQNESLSQHREESSIRT